MVSFSNADGAHCDSANGQSTVPSKTVQMDEKIPVQPSNFDVLQKGALMGALLFMKYDKTHYNQCNYAAKSIPSPGTKFISTDLHRGPFLFVYPARINVSIRLSLYQTPPNLPGINTLVRVYLRV